jgi:hypothetical protein
MDAKRARHAMAQGSLLMVTLGLARTTQAQAHMPRLRPHRAQGQSGVIGQTCRMLPQMLPRRRSPNQKYRHFKDLA